MTEQFRPELFDDSGLTYAIISLLKYESIATKKIDYDCFWFFFAFSNVLTIWNWYTNIEILQWYALHHKKSSHFIKPTIALLGQSGFLQFILHFKRQKGTVGF